MNEALSAESVGAYLVERGVLGAAEPWTAERLSGGVSSVVLDVMASGRRLVVKQPLDRFEVQDAWLVKRERVLVEAEALDLAGNIVPGSVPEVVDLDRERLVLVMEGAPRDHRSWKDELLEGTARPEVARHAGALLRAWHDGTRDEALLARFDDPEIFGQQRADPYYRTTMQRRPELAGAMEALLERMLATKACLVHGDFSPKNLLVGEEPGPVVIDWEITHPGDPAFDRAFLTNHLMLKAIHQPQAAEGYQRCAETFWNAYGDVADPVHVLAHVGCLMVARVDGKSPAEYLTVPQREQARHFGSALLLDPPGDLGEAWQRLE